MTTRQPPRRTSRPSRWLAAFVGLFVTACGGEPPGPIRVELVAFAAEGAAPTTGWRLAGEGGLEAALTPTGARGDHGAIFAAPLPGGRYALRGGGDWGPMSGSVPVPFVVGSPPPLIAVGRRGTLYAIPPPGMKVLEVRVVTVGGPQDGAPLPGLEVVLGADGRAAVRLPEGAGWGGTVAVLARLDPPGFGAADRIALPPDGTPWGVAVLPGPRTALDVTSLGPGSAPRVRALAWETREEGGLAGLELEAPLDAAGRARFEAFPLARAGASFETSSGGAAVASAALVRGDVRLRALGAPNEGPRARFRLPEGAAGPKASDLDVFQLREEGDPSYGLVQAHREATDPEGTWRSDRSLAPGRWRALALFDGRAYVSPEPVEVGAGPQDVEFPLTGGAASQAQLSLGASPRPGRRASILVRRLEGERAVLAHGFVLRDLARADHALALPTGRYRFVVEVDGREGPPVEMTFQTPGTRAAVGIHPPP